MITSSTNYSRALKLNRMGDSFMGNFSFPNFLKILGSHRSTVILYFALYAGVCVLAGYLGNLVIYSFAHNLVQAVEIGLFTCLGFLHVKHLKNKLRFIYDRSGEERLLFSFLLSLFICFALSVLYAFLLNGFYLMSVAAASAFLFPPVSNEALTYLQSIPEKTYLPWFVEQDKDDTVSIYINSLQVELQLSEKYFDISDTVYQLTVPGQIPFGKQFNRFITAQNKLRPKAIELMDEKRKPFGWEFYTEGLRGLKKTHIDPVKSLRENGVKNHTVIIAKRISHTNYSKIQKLLL